MVRWPPSPFAMEDGSVLQWGARERCSGTPSCVAMADESVRMGDRMALQWQTRVLERETEWRCNGRRECCSGRPSRVAMVDKSAVAAGDRVALRWMLSEGRCNRKSCTANRSVATGAKTLQRKTVDWVKV